MAVTTETRTIAADQRATLSRVSWETYERLLTDDEERRVPRLTYDRGILEVVTPSTPHEEYAITLTLLVEIVGAALFVPVRSVGGMTYRRSDLERGFEPDASFYVQSATQIRGKVQIDLNVDPPPDIVVEMEFSRSAINKLALFAAMGIPEVWRSDGDTVSIFVLTGETYQEAEASAALPVLTAAVLTSFLRDSQTLPRPEWFRRVSEWAADQHEGDS